MSTGTGLVFIQGNSRGYCALVTSSVTNDMLAAGAGGRFVVVELENGRAVWLAKIPDHCLSSLRHRPNFTSIYCVSASV